MTSPLKRVVVIGIGNMGWPMAARLVAAGFEVAVSDVTPGRADSFAKEIGGAAATDLAAVVAQADAVITMLPTSQHVEAALEEIDAALHDGHIIVDMTSGLPATTKRLAAALAPRGIALVDAPVSGRRVARQNRRTGDHDRRRRSGAGSCRSAAARDGHHDPPHRRCRRGAGDEGVEQSGLRGRVPDGGRSAGDRPEIRARSRADDGCAQCLHRHEQFAPRRSSSSSCCRARSIPASVSI